MKIKDLIFSTLFFGSSLFAQENGFYVRGDSLEIEKQGYKIERKYNFANETWYEVINGNNNDVNNLRSQGLETYSFEDATYYGLDDEELIPEYIKYGDKKWNFEVIGLYNEDVLRILGEGNGKVTIFVPDTGWPTNLKKEIINPDFVNRGRIKSAGNYVPIDSTSRDSTGADLHGHSTHIIGVLADINRIDTTYVDKVSTYWNEGKWPWFQASLEKATQHAKETGDIVLVSVSLGGGPWPPLERQLKYLDSLYVNHNIKVGLICAAGNPGNQTVVWPAQYRNRGYLPGYYDGYKRQIIAAVGSIFQDTTGVITKSDFSSYDRDVHIYAPGGTNATYDPVYGDITGFYYRHSSTSILSAASPIGNNYMDRFFSRYENENGIVDSLYRYMSGTSAATPHITASTAEFLRQNPDFPFEKLEERLQDTGESFNYYGLDSIDVYQGKYIYLPRFLMDPVVTYVGNSKDNSINNFRLYQNYPNPFNSSTQIKYALIKGENVLLDVYDMLGRKIKTLVNEKQSPGNYNVKFNANDLASGVYIYRLKLDKFINNKKMLLIK